MLTASCVEITKGRKSVGPHAGHIGVARVLGLNHTIVESHPACTHASKALRGLKGAKSALSHLLITIDAFARCSNATKRHSHYKKFKRASKKLRKVSHKTKKAPKKSG